MSYQQLLPVLAIIFCSCQSAMETVNTNIPKDAKLTLVDPSIDLSEKTDAINIKLAEQNGDYVMFDVSYSGGCETHVFELVSRGDFEATYPPEVEVKLFHNANGDRCRSIVDTKLYFDLRPLRYDGTNMVKLVVINDNKTLTYNY